MNAAATPPPRQDLKSSLPRLGLREFWYPAARSSKITGKPTAIKLLGEEVAFYRSQDGQVYAVHNRCPHRGMPMDKARCHFDGTISCAYHGWTFDTKGECVAALNEGPESTLPGKVRIRTYPVEERRGLVWVYMGVKQPKPIEEDVPPELLDPGVVSFCQTELWDFNWLPGLENLQDTHDLFVHRNSIFFLFVKIPAWAKVGAVETPDGRGVSYKYEKVGPLQANYPKIGKWPPKVWWRRFQVGSANQTEYLTAELKLPGLVRVGFSAHMYLRYMVPVDENHCRAFLFSCRRAKGLGALSYSIYYYLWASWSLLKLFIGQDTKVFEVQDYTAPERLSITDVGLVKWRRVIAAHAEREISATNTATVTGPRPVPDFVQAR